MRYRKAFTVIEFLIVVGILLLLAGISAAVFTRIKASARSESGKSLMKQQHLALALYADSWSNVYPPFDVANSAKQLDVGCAADDTWSQPCRPRSAPMIGSFAYVEPLLSRFNMTQLTDGTPLPVLASIFAADYKVSQFEGIKPPNPQGCATSLTCEYPEQVWFVWTDGSLRRQRNRRPPQTFEEASALGTRELFSWSGAFLREAARNEQR